MLLERMDRGVFHGLLYMRTKGQAEEVVKAQGFASASIFRCGRVLFVTAPMLQQLHCAQICVYYSTLGAPHEFQCISPKICEYKC